MKLQLENTVITNTVIINAKKSNYRKKNSLSSSKKALSALASELLEAKEFDHLIAALMLASIFLALPLSLAPRLMSLFS